MRRVSLTFIFAVFIIVMAVLVAEAQTAPKPAFEIISVKRNTSGVNGGTTVGVRGDRYYAPNVTPRILIHNAFVNPGERLLLNQIIGGPDWIDTERFDVQAKMQGDANTIPPAQRQLMIQALLEDRFQLKAHQETRDTPVYGLVVEKTGLKMKLSEDQTPPSGTSTSFDSDGRSGPPLARGFMRVSTGPYVTVIAGKAATVSALVNLLQGSTDRIVMDKTNLKGLFDFSLRFSRLQPDVVNTDTAPDVQSAPSLFTAIQELGLRLEPSKAPLGVVVIDSVQRPTEN
jgi:uncharacterized protein (TIGR03435 family)